MPEVEPHDKYCTGCQIVTLMHERDEAERRLSTFRYVGDGVYQVSGMRRSALTGRYLTDHLPDEQGHKPTESETK